MVGIRRLIVRPWASARIGIISTTVWTMVFFSFSCLLLFRRKFLEFCWFGWNERPSFRFSAALAPLSVSFHLWTFCSFSSTLYWWRVTRPSRPDSWNYSVVFRCLLSLNLSCFVWTEGFEATEMTVPLSEILMEILLGASGPRFPWRLRVSPPKTKTRQTTYHRRYLWCGWTTIFWIWCQPNRLYSYSRYGHCCSSNTALELHRRESPRRSCWLWVVPATWCLWRFSRFDSIRSNSIQFNFLCFDMATMATMENMRN